MEYISQIGWRTGQGTAESNIPAGLFHANIFHITRQRQCHIMFLLNPEHSSFFELFSFLEQNTHSDLPWA